MGEATLHPRLFPFLGYVRGKKVAPTKVRQFDFMPSILISNGMWSSAQVQQCIENPPDVLSLSLAGLTDDEFIERRGGISLKQFRKNVERLYNERKVRRAADGGYSPTIHVATHIYPHEMETRAEDIERFKSRWFEVADVVVIKVTVVKQGNNTTFTRNPVHSAHLRYNDIGDDHYERSAPCFETSRRLSVNSDGNIWCGHHLSENFGTLLGNIKEQSLRDIWFGDAMNEFRRQVRAGVFNRPGCRSCGGELRDFHRNPTKVVESEIRFS
jgi:radical SAM protein with 4Fe4S-binding SPASM domain